MRTACAQFSKKGMLVPVINEHIREMVYAFDNYEEILTRYALLAVSSIRGFTFAPHGLL